MILVIALGGNSFTFFGETRCHQGMQSGGITLVPNCAHATSHWAQKYVITLLSPAEISNYGGISASGNMQL